jgi:tetratricopeptide (TPR) repeat protein
MTDNSRIEDLRRRVQKDPASIAFAQLAEEYRRAGQFEESVEACRAGLATHPGYLSARVTLGRALIELDQFDEAEQELSQVLKSAPDNLAAIRGTADIHRQRGNLAKALEYYRAALHLAKNDPDLQETVADLTKKVAPTREAELKDGLTFDDMQRELSARVALPVQEVSRPQPVPPRTATPGPALVAPVAPIQADRDRALRTIAALEQWLGAIHAARPQPAA